MKTANVPDQTIALLKKVLDLRADKEKVIASNIANSETPGYAPARLNFQDQLRQALRKDGVSLQTTHDSHIPVGAGSLNAVRGLVTREKDTTGIGDKNGVNLADEMMALSENELLYETAAQLLNKKLSIKKYIISGGQ